MYALPARHQGLTPGERAAVLAVEDERGASLSAAQAQTVAAAWRRRVREITGESTVCTIQAPGALGALGPCTMTTAGALAAILKAAQTGAQVARRLDSSGRVDAGTARCIGDEDGNHAPRDSDIRDLWLRVTLRTGFEAFWPVGELTGEHDRGEFIAEYR